MFAGQYGDGYEDLFSAFAAKAHRLVQRHDSLFVVISPHPRTDGSLEGNLLQQYGHNRLVMAAPNLGTDDLSTISDIVMTWRSTVGIQAAFYEQDCCLFRFVA